MEIVHICLGGVYTDGFSYQENILAKYHKKIDGNNVSIVATTYQYNEKGVAEKTSRQEYFNDDGVRIVRIKDRYNIRFLKKMKTFNGLRITLEKINPDIIFIHGVQFIDIKEVVKYLKKHPEVKVFADNHADFSNSATNWLSKNILHKIIWKHCAKMIEPYVTRFYGVLPARVEFLRDVYDLPQEKIELLVMGADDEKVEEAQNVDSIKQLRSKHNIADDDFLVMTGGKIDKWKTQTLLLMDAVNNIENKNVKLIVFGSVVPELKEEVNKRCSDKVQYIGWIQAEDSYKYFAACDLAVFPGRHSVFWEQVCGQGKPIVAKEWHGTTHVDMNGNCILLKQDSEEEIRNVISELVEDKNKYAKMCECAQQKGKEMFLYSNIAARSIEE